MRLPFIEDSDLLEVSFKEGLTVHCGCETKSTTLYYVLKRNMNNKDNTYISVFLSKKKVL
jgi:hypothetical protein